MTETPERACPNCGPPQRQWKENGGHGFLLRGQTYCCRGCAESGPGSPRPATAPTGAPAGSTGCTCL